MDSVDTQWMPATGLHTVSLGSSLSRALKARKGGVPPKRSNLPDRDFYSFRCESSSSRHSQIAEFLYTDNFKPESIDPDRPGSVEVRRGKDSTSVTLERPSTQVSYASHNCQNVEARGSMENTTSSKDLNNL